VAKQLFSAPTAMLAQAAGAASMPFFASLWSRQRHYEFAVGVADSVSRVSALGLLTASAMMALAAPLVELLFAGGRFTVADSRQCAAYFAVFSISLALWSAQSLYARAFFAAGNTFLPMVAATAVTLVSIPIYAILYRWYGAMGLAFASNLGMALQTAVLAVLLHQKRMVSMASLDYAEMGRCLLAGVTAGGAVWLVFSYGFGQVTALVADQPLVAHLLHKTRWIDLMILLAGSWLWVVVAKGVLEKSGSALPRVMIRKMKMR